MPKFTLVRHEDGSIGGASEKDERAWKRTKDHIRGLPQADSVVMRVWIPRSPGFHKRHFVMLDRVFDAQEQFSDDEAMRKWCEVGAGYFKEIPGPDGKWVPMPLSIDYETLDDVEFRELHDKVRAFLFTPRAYRFLWPHLPAMKAYEMMSTVIDTFDANKKGKTCSQSSNQKPRPAKVG